MTTLHGLDLTVHIIYGPSREDMFDSLRLANENRKVNFKLNVRDSRHQLKFVDSSEKESNSAIVELTTSIEEIERFDASGNMWFAKIRFLVDLCEQDCSKETTRIYCSDYITTNISYNTDSRIGNIMDRGFINKVMRLNKRLDELNPGGLWFTRYIARNL